MLKFFYSTATCSTATHIALEEAGLPYTGVEVSWQRKVNVDELEKVSALGAVPALVIDGQTLTQTSAIMEYIGSAQPKLLAKTGSFERLKTMEWVAFAAADLQKTIGVLFQARRAELDDANKEKLRAATFARLEKYLAYVDANLAGRDFIMGKEFTVADASLFTILGWTKWIELKTAPYKNVTAYMKRVYARPAVQKVLKAEGLTDYLQD